MPSSPVPVSAAEYFTGRAPLRRAFLDEYLSGCGPDTLLKEDWGTRRYYRVTGPDGSPYVLMEAVPDHFPYALPGHKISDFLRIGHALEQAGLHPPSVIAAQAEQGYLLLEDLGDTSFFDAVAGGGDEQALYRLATETLLHLRGAFRENSLSLPLYTASHVHAGRRRVIDWYAPLARGARNPEGLTEDYLRVWDAIEAALPPCPQGFIHGDYHAQNLMWLPEETGLRRCGVLDFQGAMWGNLPYDLTNLLEDIRRDIPDDIRRGMKELYTRGMGAAEKEAFLAWYPVLAMQFHCRVIGQIIKLAAVQGKAGHLRHMPRLQAYVRGGLENAVLAPLADWFAAQDVSFSEAIKTDANSIAALIRPDAY